MKTRNVLSVLLLALAGCQGPEPRTPGVRSVDLLLGASLERALVVQSALYPCHFVTGGAELNELGERDLDVLARHLRDHAGSLLVRRGEATAELHQARVDTVLAALQAAGVAREQIAVHDGLPGGDGALSTRIVEVLKKPLGLSGAGISTSMPSTGSVSP